MRGYFTATVACICLGLSVIAQSAGPARYKDFVFEDIVVTRNLSYRKKEIDSIKKAYMLMDIYEPKNDSAAQRPLIIWLHGGGFKYGNKKSAGTPHWSRSFARRGYVCAAINYRLSRNKPLRKFRDLAAGCLEATEDVHAAVSFFKTYCRQYRVDTNRIILAGNSAGAMIALQAVYSNPYELARLAGNKDTATRDRQYNPSNIKMIINYWGALFDSSWLQHASVPVVNVHGLRDKIVPYESKGPLQGSAVIYRRCKAWQIPVALKSYPGCGHELQKRFNPFWAGRKAKKRWLEAGQFAADFLYTGLFEISRAAKTSLPEK